MRTFSHIQNQFYLYLRFETKSNELFILIFEINAKNKAINGEKNVLISPAPTFIIKIDTKANNTPLCLAGFDSLNNHIKSKKPNNPIEVSVVIKPESAPEDPTPIPIIGYFVNNIRLCFIDQNLIGKDN